jgi:SAM-dependent methyltransferase
VGGAGDCGARFRVAYSREGAALRWNDQRYLRDEQYRTPGNLSARMALHERFSVNRQGWQPWVFDQLALPTASRVLELGCGPGRLWRDNLPRIPAALSLVLSDASFGMVREARDALRQALPATTILAANLDAQQLPFADAQFAAVIANHMLYHLPDRSRALAEIRRVLAPGGSLYAATNGKEHLRELADLADNLEPESALPFNLEEGGAELAQHFGRVELRHYADGLVVTEAAPLVAYINSMLRLKSHDEAQLTQSIERQIASKGAVRITKATGLFIATNDAERAAHRP